MSLSSPSPLQIIFVDSHLIAVHKPAGWLTQSDAPGTPNLLEATRQWIKNEYKKPGNVYLGLVHRLDRPVSGVVLFARTSKAAGRISQQFRERTVQKIYRVCVAGVPKISEATLVHYLRKEKSLKATVFPRPTPDAKKAELDYRVVTAGSQASELEIILRTGRFHQIRAQLAFVGHPVVGDRKYGSARTLPEQQIALYARQIKLQHPTTQEEIVVESPAPPGWPFIKF